MTEFNKISTWATAGGIISGSYTPYQLLTKGGSQDVLVPVPEPEAYALALAGFGVVGFAMRRRRASRSAA